MNNTQSFFIFLSALIFCFTMPRSARASVIAPADVEWVQTNTKHFHILHDKKQQDLGLYYAEVAELAYYNLSTLFTTLPEEITLVISDNTDTSNGNATVFPYPLINIFPVLTGQQDSLAEAGEWGKELLTHELTHVAQLYPYSSTGYKILRGIFGSIISPHLLMPNWWKEGMAVEVETQFSPRGRTRSYLQDAQIRSYVTTNKLNHFTLAEVNETLTTWPYGNRQYFFGSMLMSQITKEKNSKALGDIVLEQSYVLPYIINSPVESVLNHDYPSLYGKTLDEYRKNSDKQIEILKTVTPSVLTPINSELLMSKTVQFNENRLLIGLIGTTDMKTEIQFYKHNGDLQQPTPSWQQIELDHAPTGNLGFFNFHPTEAKIIYSKTHKVNLQQNFSDIYVYDISNDKSEKITQSERARDPIYSPDGKFALYINTSDGLTELKELDLTSKKIRSLVKTDRKSRINSYTYKNSNEILYTIRDENGSQILRQFNLVLLQSKDLSAPKQIRFIKYKNDKLYFTSTENEVQNVYSSQVFDTGLANITPLTHLLTGSLNFDIDEKNKKVYSTVIGENGPSVEEINFIPNNTVLPKISNDILSRYQPHTDPSHTMTTTQSEYSAWPYIYPHYWIPFISTNITGNGLVYQALTSGSDPLAMHSYAAQLNYDSYSNKFSYLATYTNNQFDWAWNLSASQTQQLFGLSSYIQKNGYSVSLSPDTFKLNEDIHFSLGTVLNQTEDQTISTNHLGGFVQMTYSNVDQKRIIITR